MHILITDSGVGGLSVVAYAERFIRTRGSTEPVRLTFANAAPENDYGYNAMPTREAKLEAFDRFLTNVSARYEPDSIYVACNTLSVLLHETPFVRKGEIPVQGIVGTGVDLVAREMQSKPQSTAMIFGTQTTIEAGAYPRLLVERGFDPSRIISQACPGLADTISEDRQGARAREEIGLWVNAAIETMSGDGPVVACLACTHYGYRRKFFEQALAEAGICATVVDPNERAVGDLFDGETAGRHHDVEVEFVTRYAIPDATIEAISWFLGEISPRTVAAMKNFVWIPDLF